MQTINLLIKRVKLLSSFSFASIIHLILHDLHNNLDTQEHCFADEVEK